MKEVSLWNEYACEGGVIMGVVVVISLREVLGLGKGGAGLR